MLTARGREFGYFSSSHYSVLLKKSASQNTDFVSSIVPNFATEENNTEADVAVLSLCPSLAVYTAR
jgi:hypothetical protein